MSDIYLPLRDWIKNCIISVVAKEYVCMLTDLQQVQFNSFKGKKCHITGHAGISQVYLTSLVELWVEENILSFRVGILFFIVRGRYEVWPLKNNHDLCMHCVFLTLRSSLNFENEIKQHVHRLVHNTLT